MNDITTNLLGADAPIKAAIEAIERSPAKIGLVVDAEMRLIGTVTDGDIRRGLLRGCQLTDPVTSVMNANPRVARTETDRARIRELMRRNICRDVPVVDADGRVVELETLNETLLSPEKSNWVLLMAGGRGQRLRPLTLDVPKPMLQVGSRPLLDAIIRNFKEQGFQNFFVSVNYRSEVVIEHFGQGESLGVNIRYLIEDRPLGTAGPLALLPERPVRPMIVMNGDILTKVDFNDLLSFHDEHMAAATMCVRDYSFEVPFGVVEIDRYRIARIAEKPVQRFLINAGIYVLNPEIISMVAAPEPLDMTTLFQRVIDSKAETAVFPIREYWIDIGRMDDFERANNEFGPQFGAALEK
ncbi:MAG TPA: nucleotidyltransferase family protein [Stellaceae bacterium]